MSPAGNELLLLHLQFTELLHSLTQSGDLGGERNTLRWAGERGGVGRFSGSYLVLLQLQFLHVVKLLRLQLAHPVEQLVDLVPARNTSRVIARVHSFALFSKMPAYFSLSSFRWSMFRGLRLAVRIFFFFSLSVSFLPPLFWSAWSPKHRGQG